MFNSVVFRDWQSTAEGETVLQHFYDPHSSGRKLFGILERPTLPSSIEEVSYKLFVAGKVGVGKTTTIARLAGIQCTSNYTETPGIRKTNVYWPVKIWDKTILFKLQFWDAGENSMRKYSHVLTSCKEKADAILLVFSYTDAASFHEIPQLMSKLSQGHHPAKIVIGTRYSSTNSLDVSNAQTKEFELKWKARVLRMNSSLNERNEVHKISPIMNVICEQLWIRDQDYLLKQGLNS
ncbi:Ciliogenesis and planar polarity effector 2 [Frankliniella fusca]|uniref:Ciliogenesis and planar polarity effector 2 n=1 Tax=Frankliniella fusca TaxID=407009 RepID=A0AAE1GXJ5_9NEOP|nr:Ciliogenesis and planar polarity effector 2 [Frankliniella fusca]